MTTAEYAKECGITQQAVHKRLKDIKKYPEIRKVQIVSKKLFFLKVNTDKGLRQNKKNILK
jgi:predicted transcriptional regulator